MPRVAAHVFVAYPYALPRDDYRGAFNQTAQTFDVQFDFADDLLTSRHILDKIVGLIEAARFSIFDITLWNPNVTLELGLAIGRRRPHFLLFDKSHQQPSPPSNLAGIDRLEYSSFTALRTLLHDLMAQQGVPVRPRIRQRLQSPADLDVLQQLVDYVERIPGLSALLISRHFSELQLNTVRTLLDDAVARGLIGGSNTQGYWPQSKPPYLRRRHA
jgi:hypothetical protein